MALVPLALLALTSLRGDRARRAVGLPPAGLGPQRWPALAVVTLGLLVALAAAQPVLRTSDSTPVRADAAAYVVVDTSRSMLAARSPGSETRLVRARRAALALRSALPDVRVGVASLSDRVLPHLFPSPERAAFASVLARAIRAGQPAPTGLGRSGTNLTALAALPTENFFAPEVTRRAAVVITDAESDPIDEVALDAAFRAEPHTTLVLVRMGRSGEQVFDARGRPEPGYQPPGSPDATARAVAAATSGRVFAEDRADAAARAVRAALGASGPTVAHGRGERRHALAPWLVALAALPLAALLSWRNLDLTRRGRSATAATLQAARRRSSVG